MMNRHCTPQPSQPLGHPSMGHPPSGDSRRRLRACPEQRTAQPLLRGALGLQTPVRDVCVMGPRPQTITKRKTAWHTLYRGRWPVAPWHQSEEANWRISNNTPRHTSATG